MSLPRRARARAPQIDPNIWALLSDQPLPDPSAQYFFEPGAVTQAWREYGESIVRDWAAEHPGTRPEFWWQAEAPQPLRRRLGGIGTPAHERLAHGLAAYCGVPRLWITPNDLRVYESLRTPLDVPAIDPDDPPTYESQAAYLDRLGLLLPGERRRLKPADFEPESVLDIFEIRL